MGPDFIYADNNVISFTINEYQYTGGAHGGSWIASFLVDRKTGKIITDIKIATGQILTNMQALLKKTGLDLSHIVKTTIFLKDIKDFPAVNEVYAGFFPKDPPARSTVEVSVLPRDVPIEIEAIAVRE